MFGSLDDETALAPELREKARELGPLEGARTFRGGNHRIDAEAFVQEINYVIRGIFVEADEKTQHRIEGSLAAFSEQVKTDADTLLKEILLSAQQRLERTFNIVFMPPVFDLKAGDQASFDLRLGTVRDDSEYNIYYIKRAGTVAATKRWFADLFGERWGYQKVTELEDVSIVDLGALKNLAMRQLGGFETAIKLQFQSFIDHYLTSSISTYFSDLRQYLEEFRGDLLDALGDTRLEAGRLEQLQASIRQLRHDVDDLLIDAQTLAAGLALW
jgi:hypothetical protein